MQARHLQKLLLLAGALTCAALPVRSASISREYSYYGIEGDTLEEIQKQLAERGPHLGSTGQRHPGATQMQFNTRVVYAQGERSCRVVQAIVSVEAEIILPRWSKGAEAGDDVAMIWSTLASDIRRHEQSHTVIARTYARQLEQALMDSAPQQTCEQAAAGAEAVTTEILARHDEAQARFDRIELVNFEERLLRLLDYRLGGPEMRPPSR